MYKYFINKRYLRTRPISVFSIIGVTVGVMVLIVVTSVMGGFQQNFRSRLQGSLSDIVVSVTKSKQEYQALEKKIRAFPEVQACSPHLNGVVVIGTGRYYVGARVIGIDYEKEYKVSRLKEYMVTPYKVRKLWIQDLLEWNIRKNVVVDLSWKVIRISPEVDLKNKTQHTRILCEEIEKRTPKNGPKEDIRFYIRNTAFVVNEKKKVVFVDEDVPSSLVASPKISEEGKKQWQLHFDKMSRSISDRDADGYMSLFEENLRTPSSLDPEDPFLYKTNTELPPVILGFELMRQLDLRRGSKIGLVTGTRGEDGKINPVTRKFIVVGSVRSGWQEIDAHLCYVRRSDVLNFLPAPKDVSEICVILKDKTQANEVKAKLRRALNPDPDEPEILIEKWQDRRRTFLAAIELERAVMGFVLYLVIILALVMITIILVLMVAEKTKDIGILKAMGASSSGIMGIFMLNGLFISLSGALLGSGLGLLISAYVNEIADFVFEWTGFRVFPRDIFYMDSIPVDLKTETFLAIIIPTIILSFLTCSIPALKAARMDAVKALSSEFYIAGSVRTLFAQIWLWLTSFGKKKGKNPFTEKVKGGFFKVEGLSHEYSMGTQKLRTLDGLNFQVHRGEILAILGKSGAGKSTLLHTLGLLDTPEHGNIYHEGIALNTLSASRQCKVRNEKIGFIFQLYHLLPEFTALENVYLAAMIHPSWSRQKKQKIDRAKELLTMVGLEERMNHFPLQLSGGERQRVAIARALINDPDIILCDEPTGNLDEKNSLAIQKIIWELNEQMGKTFIMVTHDLSIAKKAHRVFRLSGGQVIEEDPERL